MIICVLILPHYYLGQKINALLFILRKSKEG
jgi:hypothetical protein